MLHRTMRTRILVIEDERSAPPAPWDVVFDSEYEVEIANRTNHLRSHIRDFVPHLVIINSERRQVSNADLCRELRRYEESACTPILLLTDRADESVESLDAGADDCLAKPISFREFLLRIRGLLRRAQSASTLRAADILLDLDRFRATRAGRDVHLGPIEFKLLELLMRTPGHPVPRSELMSGAWPHTRIDERTVDVHIMRLRKALTQGRRTDPIRTVRQVGYYLDGGKSSAPPESPSIIRGQPIFNDTERACAKRPASSSRHQLDARGKRHVVA
jgi:two-component system, OmpR family, phosphate regulon response regulator PhoB